MAVVIFVSFTNFLDDTSTLESESSTLSDETLSTSLQQDDSSTESEEELLSTPKDESANELAIIPLVSFQAHQLPITNMKATPGT